MTGDAEELRALLEDLERRWRAGDEYPTPFIGPEALDVFTGRAPTDVVMTYLSVLGSYRGFEGRPLVEEIRDIWLRTQLRHGDGTTGLNIALRSLRSSAPELRPRALVRRLAEMMQAAEPAEVKAAAALVEHLWDIDTIHDETFAALRTPEIRGPLDPVLRRLAPMFSADERAELRLDEP